MTAPERPLEAVRFVVRSMTCGSCVARITRELRGLEGVRAVDVDLRHERATVQRDPELVSDAALGAAVASAGYEADLATLVRVPLRPRRGLLDRLLGR